MKVLVAYASRYGTTGEIAQRIADRLTAAGHATEVKRAREAGDLAEYDAFVVGSAVYFGRWMREAADFVNANTDALGGGGGVWLFSCGPVGTPTDDASRAEQLTEAEPGNVAELRQRLGARDHRVFYGALDRDKLKLAHRFLTVLPAGRALFSFGDFREWDEIEAWADGIAASLAGEG